MLAAEPAPGQVFVPAKLIKMVDPKPPKMGLLGFRGATIRACFTVTTDGKVKDVTYPDGMFQNALDIPIKRALIRWRYEPATLDGAPVEQPDCAIIQFRAIGG